MRSLLAAYLKRLPAEVQASDGYRVLPGAEDVLRSLNGTGRVTGIVTGALEEAARIKLSRGDLNRFLPFGGSGRILRTGSNSRDEGSSAAPR